PKRNPERDVQRLVDSLRSALGDQLQSIVLFGSLASGDFRTDRSNVNILIVADLSFDTLERLAGPFKAWVKKGHVLPVLVESRDLARFARAFPIEFLDMLEQHRVLQGEDPLHGLTVDRELLRAQ